MKVGNENNFFKGKLFFRKEHAEVWHNVPLNSMPFAKLCSLLKQEQNFSSPQAESWYARESPEKPYGIHNDWREKMCLTFFPFFPSLFLFFLYIFSCLLIHLSLLLVFVNHTSSQNSHLIVYSGKYFKKEEVGKNYCVKMGETTLHCQPHLNCEFVLCLFNKCSLPRVE